MMSWRHWRRATMMLRASFVSTGYRVEAYTLNSIMVVSATLWRHDISAVPLPLDVMLRFWGASGRDLLCHVIGGMSDAYCEYSLRAYWYMPLVSSVKNLERK